MRVVAMIVLAIALAGCTDTASGGDTDALEKRSCEIFRDIAADASDGVDTLGETRDRLKDLLDGYGVSLPSTMQGALRNMVAAITAGDDSAAARGVRAFGAQCDSRGY